MCHKCKLEKPTDPDISTCSSAYFVCSSCNVKRATLSRLLGQWPIDQFSQLPEDQQTAFWRCEVKGRQAIQDALAEQVTEHRETVEKTTIGGTYLPLSVLEKQGFDPARVEAGCVGRGRQHVDAWSTTSVFGSCPEQSVL